VLDAPNNVSWLAIRCHSNQFAGRTTLGDLWRAGALTRESAVKGRLGTEEGRCYDDQAAPAAKGSPIPHAAASMSFSSTMQFPFLLNFLISLVRPIVDRLVRPIFIIALAVVEHRTAGQQQGNQ